MNELSKPIRNTDDEAKKLIIEALEGQNTYGFDIDSMFYIKSEDRWVVIEFLKTNHKFVRPSTSHPNRYWHKNWRKFVTLWRLVEALGNAELYLVNYEDETHALSQGRSDREFRIIKVVNVIPGEKGRLEEDEAFKERYARISFEEFKRWYQSLNERAGAL
ncbi:hypothetical protein D6833_06545 [Candidatus Parcubacteria bacterium]|nr:MAG: hypothetical protein D6833_06545 [Candidatus Parcubacteria bacterium]